MVPWLVWIMVGVAHRKTKEDTLLDGWIEYTKNILSAACTDNPTASEEERGMWEELAVEGGIAVER